MNFLSGALSVLALSVLSGGATIGSEQSTESPSGKLTIQRLMEMDRRLLSVGHRLLVANAAQCARTGWLSGVQLSTASQFAPESRLAVAAALGLGDHPVVTAVADQAAARRSGLAEGDAVLAVDGIAMVADRGEGPATAEFAEQAMEDLARGFADGSAVVDIRRGNQHLRLVVAADHGCDSRFVVKISRAISAGTDGRAVAVSSGLLDFATDTELAALAGHELAHIVLDDLVGRPHGGKHRIREDEADALGLVLAARAGYGVDGTASFWRRFGERDIWAPFRSRSHSAPAKRAAAADALAARISREGFSAVTDDLMRAFVQRGRAINGGHQAAKRP